MSNPLHAVPSFRLEIWNEPFASTMKYVSMNAPITAFIGSYGVSRTDLRKGVRVKIVDVAEPT